MTQNHSTGESPVSVCNHVALHLAHRWFAFLEAPGGDLDEHLLMFHPRVRLSGHRGAHLFARDHESLIAWFDTIPGEISSHHIVHSNFSMADNGDGLLNMVVAYQAPGKPGMRGSIISYETRIEFAPGAPRFIELDKTPMLSNKRADYETSWTTNRVLARVHAELGKMTEPNGELRAALGHNVRQVSAQVTGDEGSGAYVAIVTGISESVAGLRAVRLELWDDGRSTMPTIKTLEVIVQ